MLLSIKVKWVPCVSLGWVNCVRLQSFFVELFQCINLVTFVFVEAYVRQFSSCRFKVGIKVSPYFEVDCLLRSLSGLLGHHLYSIVVSKSINLQSNLP